METPEVIKRRRLELGVSQAELATAVGLDMRQIRRYETGDSQPSLPVARALADRLGITIDELAGGPAVFAGLWYSIWQGQDPAARYGGPVKLTHQGARVSISPDPDAPQVYPWRSELHVADDALLGWYIIDDPTTRSKGTLNLRLTAETLGGTWIKLSLSGLATGSLALGRTTTAAATRLTQEIDTTAKAETP